MPQPAAKQKNQPNRASVFGSSSSDSHRPALGASGFPGRVHHRRDLSPAKGLPRNWLPYLLMIILIVGGFYGTAIVYSLVKETRPRQAAATRGFSIDGCQVTFTTLRAYLYSFGSAKPMAHPKCANVAKVEK